MNRELFKKIHDTISVMPESLYMDTWEGPEDGVCGTTRCVAGWGVFHTTGEPLYSPVTNTYGEATMELARQHNALDGRHPNFPKIAGKLLDLPKNLWGLFYSRNETAAEFVRLVAEGHENEAIILLRGHLADEGIETDE